MKKKMIRWFAFSGGFTVALYMWGINGVEWAGNIVAFLVWVAFVLSLLALAGFHSDNKRKRELLDEFSKIPLWYYNLDGAFDIAVSIALAAMGETLLATLYFIHAFVLLSFRVEAQKEREEAN